MIKLLTLIILITFSCFIRLTAQTKTDKKTIKIARTDVGRRFTLSKSEIKEFRKNRSNQNSDLFKPKPGAVSDTTLLADSTFVKAYRNFAYIKARSNVDSPIIIAVGTAAILSWVALAVLFLNDLSEVDLDFGSLY